MTNRVIAAPLQLSVRDSRGELGSVFGSGEWVEELTLPLLAAEDEPMRRLAGDATTHFRSTDHSGEIAWLRLTAVRATDRLTKLTYLVAAELLQGHDETGCSLDDWEPCREYVELLLGQVILPNGV